MLTIGLAAGMLLAAGAAGAQEAKIGVVDVSQVFSEYCRVAESQAEFSAYQETSSANMEKQAGELEALQARLTKEGEVLKDEEKQKLQEEISAKRQELARGYQALQQELQEKNRALVEARVAEIYAAVKAVGEEKGFILVVNKEAVLYAPEAADITRTVIDNLNRAAAPAATP